MTRKSSFRIGLVIWRTLEAVKFPLNTLSKLGYDVITFRNDEKPPADLDIILARGPLGTMMPLAEQLLTMSPSRRPIFVVWVTEPLPNPDLPEWLRYSVSMARVQMERLAFRQNNQGEWQFNPHLQWFAPKAWRFRNYGELHKLHQMGIVDVLAISSQWFANFLRARGFDPIVAYYGYQPDLSANLELERDIPVLWIGSIGRHHRRRRLFEHIRAELKSRGVDILVIDGVENHQVYGEERTVLLNRTKIVLNISKESWDNNAARFYLTAPNRVLIVTEPTLPHTPLIPGKHLVETPIEKMADTICYYLTHEEERQRIVEQAYQLITKELTTEKSVCRIIEEVVAVHNKQ